MTSSQRKAEFYREQNLEAARIIAADPERYSGLMQEWAAMVLDPATATRNIVLNPPTATRRAA